MSKKVFFLDLRSDLQHRVALCTCDDKVDVTRFRSVNELFEVCECVPGDELGCGRVTLLQLVKLENCRTLLSSVDYVAVHVPEKLFLVTYARYTMFTPREVVLLKNYKLYRVKFDVDLLNPRVDVEVSELPAPTNIMF